MLKKQEVRKLDKVFIHKVKDTPIPWDDECIMDKYNNSWVGTNGRRLQGNYTSLKLGTDGHWGFGYDCLFDHDPRDKYEISLEAADKAIEEDLLNLAKEPNEETKAAIKELQCPMKVDTTPLCGLDLGPRPEVVPKVTPVVVPVTVPTQGNGIVSDGGSSDYYKTVLPKWLLDKHLKQGHIMLEDLAEVLFGNDFNYTNVFKAQNRMFSLTQGVGKEGNSIEYDAKKCKYYTDKQVEVFNRKVTT